MHRAILWGLALAVGVSSAAFARDGFRTIKLSGANNDAALAEDIGAVLAGSIDRANAADPDHPVKVVAAKAGEGRAVVMLTNNSALCKSEGCLMVVFTQKDGTWTPFWGVHANGWIELSESPKSDVMAYVESRHDCQVMVKGDDDSGRPMMGASYPWPCAGHDAAEFEKGWQALQKTTSKAGGVCRSEVDQVVADSFDATVKIKLKKGEADCLTRELGDVAALSGQITRDAEMLSVAYRPTVGAAFYHQTPGFD
ncbi:MAG: hypothetical protein D6782_03190, partial [Alphaproteobacteria bacterium]